MHNSSDCKVGISSITTPQRQYSPWMTNSLEDALSPGRVNRESLLSDPFGLRRPACKSSASEMIGRNSLRRCPIATVIAWQPGTIIAGGIMVISRIASAGSAYDSLPDRITQYLRAIDCVGVLGLIAEKRVDIESTPKKRIAIASDKLGNCADVE
jgi:hypothetical protein